MNGTERPEKFITARVPKDMRESLFMIARTRGFTLSQLIRRILEQYLKQRKAA
jgi:predicted DNA-binding protein